ncbi:hypothetical protein AG1IA_04137 [Rhizoctonia solani AG-1 IA]|uniref:Glycerophosphocholine acyltransferase 1 n=1 Tax=Thanatephorus cucumeris (strain AG1-IA) TaxID=983506 RepID=L8WYD8_THACA|nr:hypothetical protein AG1IA_04137 [Rhizoctonia solani AG-1 IA]
MASKPVQSSNHLSTPALVADTPSSVVSDASPLESPRGDSTVLPTPNLKAGGYQSEKFTSRDDSSQYWAGSLTLLDTLETYFDSRIDLLERRFKHHSDRWKRKAGYALKRTTSEALKRTKTPTELTRLYDERSKEIEVELAKIKKKFQKRISTVQDAWESATVVRTREKVSFFYGVMMVLASALLFGLAPEWLHVVYSVHVAYFLPTRFYVYKKKHWYVGLTLRLLGKRCDHLAEQSCVSRPRQTLTNNDWIYLTNPCSHFYPNVKERFPAAAKASMIYAALILIYYGDLIWQTLYWKFVLVDKRKKIESGQRTTSFSFLLNEKRGAIGKALSSIPAQYRELGFMMGQLELAEATAAGATTPQSQGANTSPQRPSVSASSDPGESSSSSAPNSPLVMGRDRSDEFVEELSLSLKDEQKKNQ